MSSDDCEHCSPVLPRDSDRGSSVSSELQDEYEELLRCAVVTPRFELSDPSQLLRLSQLSRPAGGTSQKSLPPEEAEATSARASPLIQESPAQVRAEETLTRPPVALGEAQRPQAASETSRQINTSPTIAVVTEIFASEEKMNKMENILDTWSDSLKANVLTELRKWKLAFMEQHRLELRKERERHEAQAAELRTEMCSLKDLLHTYEISNQRKDEVIRNLSRAIDRQRERLELMRSFTHWRLQRCSSLEEAQGTHMAEQHYQLRLKRKVWLAWHSLISRHWKEQVERACRLRAEEVCVQLSYDYEARMAEHVRALQKAQTEIVRLQQQREHYEDSMKKAFMRGVCALNMEALSMFQGGDGQLDNDAPLPPDEQCSRLLADVQARPTVGRSTSPVVTETPPPQGQSSSEIDSVGPGIFSAQPLPSTSVLSGALPPGGGASSFRQSSSRNITAGQQKPVRVVTARLTGRPEVTKGSRMPSNLQVMGVTPPMSSVVVERHHPVTQLTVGQATASKFPRVTNQAQARPGSRSTRDPHGPPQSIHPIKVVD
ncbi:centrosomal protein POC5 [Denticeps clupeoides]|uniref:Centrosomal protein POC5 n=1 Tax=Denticeps clupeoides TaxID=299321 RepID=A0AAY4BGL9_9TELE|nr:centrosomal protein POC5 [Denticeps clupeoides]